MSPRAPPFRPFSPTLSGLCAGAARSVMTILSEDGGPYHTQSTSRLRPSSAGCRRSRASLNDERPIATANGSLREENRRSRRRCHQGGDVIRATMSFRRFVADVLTQFLETGGQEPGDMHL